MAEAASEPPGGDAPKARAEHPSDHWLLQRFRNGYSDASTLLYLRYARRLHALAAARTSPELAQRFDPEDIVQCVFREFYRKAALGLYHVPDGEEIWNLLLIIALNQIRSAETHHRAAKRDVRVTAVGEAFERAIGAQAGGDETALNALRLTIDQVLESLPPLHRRIVELRLAGYEVAEIARETGCSKRSVERILQRFRNRLGDSLREDG